MSGASPKRAAFPAVAVTTLILLAVGVLLQVTGRPTSVGPSPTTLPTATPSATADARRVYQSDLGYSIVLVEGWRRSDLLSLRAPGTGVLVGDDVFTRRTPEDERANIGGETGGPGGFWTLTGEGDKNRDGLRPKEWGAEGHVGFGSGQRARAAA